LRHQYLQGAVAPRPIALVSTVDAKGQVNLSPFSFFNLFSSTPPIVVFSPSRRVRDNTTKHTLQNVEEVPEVVIHTVNYSIVEQVSLSSTEYAKGVNEFMKAGFTEVASELVKPPRVAEAPVAMECKVLQIIPLGTEGGAGNLVVCEVMLMHIQEAVLDAQGAIDPNKLDAVARLGGDWYARAKGQALFEVAKPLAKLGIGFDQLPPFVRNSDVLTGNHLAKLANVEALPTAEEVAVFAEIPEIMDMMERFANHAESLEYHFHQLAKKLLDQGRVTEAWLALLQLQPE
jgi:flavin reductase (DIM6/NTAB) family NADH-FMN oxidoreductase RutF